MRSLHLKALVLAIALAIVCAMPSFAFAASGNSPFTSGTLSATSGDDALMADVQASVSYCTHIRGSRWMPWVENGAGAGITGSVVDALKFSLNASVSGSIQYQVYVKGKGWLSERADGRAAGVLGKDKGVQAVRIALAGDIAKYYDISYCVKAGKGDWQAWCTNGAVAGKAGSGKSVSAIMVKLEKKSQVGSSGDGLIGVRYRARMQNGKWQVWQANNANAGKPSGKARIYGMAIDVDRGTYTGDIRYRVRLTSGKWKGWKKNGASTGKNSHVEAVQIVLTGELAEKYDVVYRANISGVKWQRNMRNGEVAGTTGRGLGIRALRVKLVDKQFRTGWIGSGESWQYFKNGTPVKSCWVVTKESPIDEMQGSFDRALHYWIDSSGYMATDRIIDPNSERDAGAEFMAYAMRQGYIMTNETRMINGAWYTADNDGVLTQTAASTNELVERYVTWALNIANDNKHGYSQSNRWGPDYDCSSLVVAALSNSGFQVGNAVWTGNLKSELTKYGFKWHTNFSKLKRGDILLVHNNVRQHTEIYIGDGKTVGAHIAETGGINGKTGDQTGNEISVAPYYSIWAGYLRYAGK